MSLDALLRPASIAVVGASRDPAKLGHVLLKNVLDYGFTGRVFPVNPSGGEVLGLPVHASIGDLPEAPDLVLLSIPNRHVPGVLREAASKGARAAVVLSSGFGEMGGEGASLQDEVRASGLRILGPNCMGVYNRPAKLNATYFWELPRTEGRVAFISQSGAYGGMTFREMGRRGVGVSTFVSIGNQADVTHADVLEHLAGDEETEVVALFIEEVRDGKRFLDACRRAARTKAVVAFKVGRTSAGRRAAQSHTGSMAGDAEVCRAALRQAGAFVARETDEFFDALAAYAAYPKGLRRGGGLAIVTISGGPCVAAADACEEAGVAVPELSARTQARVKALIPEFGAPRNPVDMTPQMDPERMPECVEAVAGDPRIKALLAINVGLDRPGFADAFTRLRGRLPVVAFTVDAPEIAKRFGEAKVPVFSTPERAVRALAALGRGCGREIQIPNPRSQRNPKSQPQHGIPVLGIGISLGSGIRDLDLAAPPLQVLDERESKRLLAEAGVPVCREAVATTLAAAGKAAGRLGYPVVLKALGAGAHKSDVGGVRVGLRDRRELASTWKDLTRKFGPSILVQEMVRGDHEVLIGARLDPTFGPVVVFGSGGVWTEQARDVSLRVCPVTRREAAEMIAETRAGERLAGMRGTAPGDVPALTAILVSLSRWMVKHADVVEVDLNPVITGGPRTAAVDALVVRRPLTKRIART